MQLGRSALHYAALRGVVSIVDLLVSLGHCAVGARDRDGRTPLQLAAAEKRPQALKYLLEHDAEYIFTSHPLLVEIVEGDFADQSDKSSALECLQIVINYLSSSSKPFDVNTRSKVGDRCAALACAARDNKLSLARYLVSLPDIEVDKVDMVGRTALHYAVSGRFVDMVRLLVERGADVAIDDKENYTPIMLCAAFKVIGEDALPPEAINKSLEIVDIILARQVKRVPRKLNIGDVAHGKTALHLAVENGRVFLTQKIVAVDVDLDCTDHKLRTPLMYCAVCDPSLRDRCLSIAGILIDKRCDINQKDFEKKTALHLAAKFGNTIPSCLP